MCSSAHVSQRFQTARPENIWIPVRLVHAPALAQSNGGFTETKVLNTLLVVLGIVVGILASW